MTSILTSAQHIRVTDPASMSSNRLDSVSSKADKSLFNITYSKNIAFKYRESERLADEAVNAGNSVPPVGRQS